MTTQMTSNHALDDIQQKFDELFNSGAPLQHSSKGRAAFHPIAHHSSLVPVVRCNGRVLRSSTETLADVCRSTYDTIEVSVRLAGGMLNCFPYCMCATEVDAEEQARKGAPEDKAKKEAEDKAKKEAEDKARKDAGDQVEESKNPRNTKGSAEQKAEERAKTKMVGTNTETAEKFEARCKTGENTTSKKEAEERKQEEAEEKEKKEAGEKTKKEAGVNSEKGADPAEGPLVFRSISSSGLDRALRELARQAALSSEPWRRMTQGGARVSSHDLRSVFKNRVERGGGAAAEVFQGRAPFHPHDRFPGDFSSDPPDVAITYTWHMCLLTELPCFLRQIDEELERELGRKPR